MNRSAFDSFLDDYFQARFEWDPAWATQAGIHDFDERAPDRSAKAHLARINTLRALAERASNLDSGSLSDADRLDRELIEGQIQDELLDLEGLQEWRHNPIPYIWLSGQSVDSLMKRNFAPAGQRLQCAIPRLAGVVQIIQAMKANLDNPPKEFTELASRIARGSVSFFGETIDRWAREAADGNAALLKTFEGARRSALEAIESGADWLEHDLLPRSKGRYAIGHEAFASKLRNLEQVEIPIPQLMEMARANLERDFDAFVETAAHIDSERTPPEVMRALSDDHPTGERLLEAARNTVEGIVGFLTERDLISLPTHESPSIVPTPPYYRFGAFAAMDTPGAFESKAREAYYYVTPPETDWDAGRTEEHLRLFNRPALEIITIHEAYPGHYVHLMNSRRFPTRTRRLILSDSNVEGWAHYSEQMMVEEGYRAADLRLRLAQLHEALLRDCRFVAAIGLHTGAMSVEEAAGFFIEKGFQETSNAWEEARRGTYDPTYLSYALGKLQIYKLRDDWKKHTGSEELKRFHDAFVLEGGLPLRLLRRRMLGHDETSTLYEASFYRNRVGGA